MPNPKVQTIFDPTTFTATHLVWDPATKRAAIIDPVLDFDPKAGRTSAKSADALLAAIAEEDVRVDWILETHAHADHLSAAPLLRQKTGAKVVIGAQITDTQKTFKRIFNLPELAEDGSQFDRLVRDGERLPLGDLSIEVLHTPGHTPACMTYVIGDAAFVGDTLFMPDYGSARCDFPGGDARALYRSIQRIFGLPPETRLFLCHDYMAPGREEFAWETTIAAQRAHNVHVHDGVSEEAFVAMRNARDRELTKPALLLPAIQVNIRAGAFPSPESNGSVYLKLPIDVL